MLETLTDLPPNTVGWRASGTITREEYDEQILEPIHAAISARGGKLNLIFETAGDFGGLDLGALYEDTKASGAIGIRHRHDWGKLAVITDEAWMRKAIAAFGWLVPGHHRVFGSGQLDDAKLWIAGG
jgi:hypothetical protein